jgi:hypothetical protein
MRSTLTITALVLSGCSTLDPLEKNPFEEEVGTDTAETVDTGNEIDTADTASEEEDPCDLTFRAYAEDDHYVDVTVGAMPLVTATGGSTTINSATSVFSTTFSVTSKMGCGSVEVTGVQILIERADGEEIPKTETDENELVDVTTDVTEFAPSGWYGAVSTSDTAPTIGMDWNSVWTGDDIGSFESYVLGPNDTREYVVYPHVLDFVPAGEYVMTYALTWRDIETGTEVWAADLDHADWHITVE